jgi:hypothetical protein
MPSITSWMRLEPRSRNAEMKDSLQARIYDPLWMLARQWQLGEFEGEDNGSPVMARWRAEVAPITRYHAGAIAPNTRADAARYDGTRAPLETVVERETVRPSGDEVASPQRLRLAVEAGQHFLRLLDAQPVSQSYRDAFITRFAFAPLSGEQRAALDAASLAYFDITGPRVPDGRRLYATLRASSGRVTLPPDLPVAAGDVAEVEKAARSWIDWYERLFSEPGAVEPTWSGERMEYAFSVGARLGDGERVLTASEYYEGRLDWYAFDSNPEVSLSAVTDPPPTEVVRAAIPAPPTFRGMPALRFWEFEDAQVDFGSVDAGPTDLGRMLLVEFALAYGNDWFVMPVDLDVGALYRTRSLVVTDTFGVRSLVPCSSDVGAPSSAWRMFQHSYTHWSGLTKPESNLFFLAPTLISNLESAPVEEVLFARDEMANVAWAIERRPRARARPRHATVCRADAGVAARVALSPRFARAAVLGTVLARADGLGSASAARRGARHRRRATSDPCAGPDPRIRSRAIALRRGSAARGRPGHPQLSVGALDRRLVTPVGGPTQGRGPRRELQQPALRRARAHDVGRRPAAVLPAPAVSTASRRAAQRLSRGLTSTCLRSRQVASDFRRPRPWPTETHPVNLTYAPDAAISRPRPSSTWRRSESARVHISRRLRCRSGRRSQPSPWTCGRPTKRQFGRRCRRRTRRSCSMCSTS